MHRQKSGISDTKSKRRIKSTDNSQKIPKELMIKQVIDDLHNRQSAARKGNAEVSESTKPIIFKVI